jgi:hypothetical protein|tara:strand:- start:19918 stop:20079 length:162 start_codon:yes stop_codon:yes gene_type:complete
MRIQAIETLVVLDFFQKISEIGRPSRFLVDTRLCVLRIVDILVEGTVEAGAEC